LSRIASDFKQKRAKIFEKRNTREKSLVQGENCPLASLKVKRFNQTSPPQGPIFLPHCLLGTVLCCVFGLLMKPL
jgi:hypothetical protein